MKPPRLIEFPTRNAQTIPCRVTFFRVQSTGPRIYERLQAFQLPTRDARRDMALARRR